MVLGVPTNFQAMSNVIANYDFVDIASGTGYITFYAGNTVDKSLLSNFAYYSDVILTNLAGSTNSDQDYDAVLNRPLDVSGLGIVNIPIYVENHFYTVYAIAYLRKWNGVTETEIVNNQSRNYSSDTTYTMLSVDLDIPLTHFKIGETLRLTIKVFVSGAGANVGRYAHDPMNRTTGWDASGAVPSKLIFQCPVRLNL